MRKLTHWLLLTVLFAINDGCSRHDKESRLIKADRYYSAGEYDKAEIEYLNVIQGDLEQAVAMGRLGLIYFEEGRLARSVPYLLKARELQPKNLPVRTKLGWAYLNSGKRKEARGEAIFILDQDSNDAEALLLLAKASVSPAEIDAARQRFAVLPGSSQQSAASLVALGTLDCQQGHFNEAEKRFKQAEKQEPNSSAPDAALGALYWAQKDLVHAEEAFATAAKFAPSRSTITLQLAQLRLQKGDRAAAQKTLEDLVKKTPDFLTPWILLADMAVSDNALERGEALVAKVLAREPHSPEALLLRTRIKLAKGDAQGAISETEKIVVLYPQAAQAHYQLGQAYLVAGEVGRAISSLNQAVALSPNFADALILLAGVNITKGDLSAAIVILKSLIHQRPDLAQPRLLLAEAYRRRNDLEGALGVYHELEQLFPGNPQTSWLIGLVFLQKDRKADARQAFEHTLELQPAYLPAVEQLVNLELADAHYEAAKRLVDGQITRNPNTAEPYLLLAQIFLAQDQTKEAEGALQKAILLEPTTSTAYLMLARLYINSHQQEKALIDLKDVLTRKPTEVTALMLMGVIYEQDKNDREAANAYEKLLAINPRFSAALNNLAYLYSEHMGQLDRAFEMAKRARELLPTEPNTADTLGWILYKRHQYPWAFSLLAESARALPSNAEISYHLGMVQYRLGEEGAARLALDHAMEIGKEFPGIDEARKALAVLAVSSEAADGPQQQLIDQRLEQQPDDPVALSRRGSFLTRQGKLTEATAAFESALKESPTNVSVMLNLAELQRRRGDLLKATDLAKQARQEAPNNPEIAHALGRLANETSNYRWAVSLLREVIAKQPDNAEAFYDLAQASYGIGHIEDATSEVKRALETTVSFPDHDNAKALLDMIQFMTATTAPTDAVDTVNQRLKVQPKDLAALMIKARIAEDEQNVSLANTIYQDILNQSPNFTLAKKGLARLYCQEPADLEKARVLATSAREDLSDDPGLAKILGIVAYRQGDFRQASTFLKPAASHTTDDGELMYYWGSTQYRLKEVGSRQSLERALTLRLTPLQASEAKKLLDALP